MKETILIVDDSSLSVHMLTTILKDTYTIISATSGEGALEMLEQRLPDLVLLDIIMPVMDGFDVLRIMKAQKKFDGIPVIFVTGESDVDTEEKGLALGAVDYIKKPYNTSIIKARVRTHLDLKSYRDNLESLVKKRTEALDASREAIIMSMAFMSENHDKVTGEHIQRIKDFTRITSEKIMDMCPECLSEQYASQTVLFSTLHDVGKVGISDVILKKDGVLTREEYEVMKSHTLVGANLLRKTEHLLKRPLESEGLRIAIEIAEYHHERFDGTGYPHGLKGEEIPMSARIVTLADIYDALRSSRPYKNALTHEEAVRTILEGDNRTNPGHFDPLVLEAFKLVNRKFINYY